MKFSSSSVIALGLVLLASSPVAAKEEALSPMALQQIQARDFEATMDIVFPAIVTVLQDSGYRITEADRLSGFVTGVGSSEQKTTFNLWWGFGRQKDVPTASVFSEQRGRNMTRVRFNFVMSRAKSRNQYSDEKPITDPTVYRDAFERLEREIFVRQAMDAPSPPVPAPTPAPPPPASDAEPTVVAPTTGPATAPPAASPTIPATNATAPAAPAAEPAKN